MAESLQQLGQRIRDFRKARGWSQEQFADVCGVHRTYMGHIERGEKNLSFSTLVRLSEALGMTLPELLADVRTGAERLKGKATTKTTPRIAASSGDKGADLPGIIRELNVQRSNLEETAGALKNMANALRTHERRVRKGKKS